MATLVGYVQLNFVPAAGAGTPATPNAAGSFQIVTPWGASQACSTWAEAFNEAFQRNSTVSGKMGAYFNLGTTNGLTTSIAGTATANDINSTP